MREKQDVSANQIWYCAMNLTQNWWRTRYSVMSVCLMHFNINQNKFLCGTIWYVTDVLQNNSFFIDMLIRRCNLKMMEGSQIINWYVENSCNITQDMVNSVPSNFDMSLAVSKTVNMYTGLLICTCRKARRSS